MQNIIINILLIKLTSHYNKGINQVFHTYIIKTEKRDELLKFLSEKV